MSLAADLRRAIDPVALCDAIGMVPDHWQIDALRSDAKREIWITSRQAGKTTTAALLAAHMCLYGPAPTTTLILSPSQRQSQLLFEKVKVTVRALAGQVKIEGETTQSLTMASGSRVYSLPGAESGTVRGYSAVNLIILDEAARIPVDLYQAVRPMLAVSRGRLICLSTPGGRRGWLWDEWSGDADWRRVSVTADSIPRISAEFLESERAALGALFEQEYFGAWLQDETQYFSSETVAKIFKKKSGAEPPQEVTDFG